jgi:hypothetical protein
MAGQLHEHFSLPDVSGFDLEIEPVDYMSEDTRGTSIFGKMKILTLILALLASLVTIASLALTVDTNWSLKHYI